MDAADSFADRRAPAGRPADADASACVAAVDLGSNSFHLLIRHADDHNQVIDQRRETVRLAAGLTANHELDSAAQQRALACLQRFGQRLRGLPCDHVRAVGTQALRRARNSDEFLVRAEAALGHGVDVIYAAEEARLIYAGVTSDLGADRPRRLVIDIGGSSTELIVGQRKAPELIDSLSLGAVDLSRSHFDNGAITPAAWQAAVGHVRAQLQPLEQRYRTAGWDMAIGASGSIRAVQTVCEQAGWCGSVISRAALRRLGEALMEAGHIDAFDYAGLSEQRRPIFHGGAALLAGLFDSFGLEQLAVTDKALREGLILDLLDRKRNRDPRHATVAATLTRFGVDRAHGERVAATAGRMLEQAGGSDEDHRLLAWAALTHEIGFAVARKGYHKHGEYLMRHADLPGFARGEQAVLAALVRLHRGEFAPAVLDGVPASRRRATLRLAALVRLAVLLHRDRGADIACPTVTFDGDVLALECPADWLASQPLTRANLEAERTAWRHAGLDLRIHASE